MILTVQEYNSITGQNLSPFEFSRLYNQVYNRINAHTWGRLAKFEETPDYIKSLIIDMIYTSGNFDKKQGISSEANDGQSISYNSNFDVNKSLNKMMFEALSGKTTADGIPLLYGGV